MSYSYIQVVQEIVEKAGIPLKHVFDIRQHPLGSGIEKKFLARFQNELDAETYWSIKPAKIYIGPDLSLNACALKRNGYYLINFNFGMFPIFLRLFTANNVTFSGAKMKKFRQLEVLEKFSLEDDMFHFSTFFIFYHEMAHLIQMSYGHMPSIEERYNLIPSSSNFSLQSHLYELEADSYAALILGREIGKIWLTFQKINQTQENLHILLVCGMATIFVMFLSLQNPYSPIYYKEGDHPHPFVRTIYSLPNVLDGIQRILGIEYKQSEKTMFDVMDITDTILMRLNQPLLAYSAPVILENVDNTTRYVHETLLANANLFPELMMNRVPNVRADGL